jgi:hypothetical protein
MVALRFGVLTSIYKWMSGFDIREFDVLAYRDEFHLRNEKRGYCSGD